MATGQQSIIPFCLLSLKDIEITPNPPGLSLGLFLLVLSPIHLLQAQGCPVVRLEYVVALPALLHIQISPALLTARMRE
jgi:hypothetical protein